MNDWSSWCKTILISTHPLALFLIPILLSLKAHEYITMRTYHDTDSCTWRWHLDAISCNKDIWNRVSLVPVPGTSSHVLSVFCFPFMTCRLDGSNWRCKGGWDRSNPCSDPVHPCPRSHTHTHTPALAQRKARQQQRRAVIRLVLIVYCCVSRSVIWGWHNAK